MNRKLRRILFVFSFSLYTFNFLLLSCNTTEPPIKDEPAVKDTITVQVTQTTHRSITLNITSTFNKPAKSIELYRRRNNLDSLVESYTAFTLEKEIIDDDSGKGLIIDTEYKYFAVRVDTANNRIDTSEVIIARTLPPTSHDYTWEEFTIGDEGCSNLLYDVWGTDENNVYAVGVVRIDGVYYGVLHWDGNNWIPIADAGGRAIFGFSENDIWVAGGGVFHYDGNKWNQIDSKLVNNRAVILDSVLFENREYTCIWGTSSDNLYLGNMWGKIIHWDGEKASIFYEKHNCYISKIKGIDKNDIWITGWEKDGNHNDLIIYYNGSSWENENKIPFYPLVPNDILRFNKKENLIVGNTIIFGKKDNWSVMKNPATAYINSIDGSKANNIFAVGAYNLLLHFNGIDWHKYTNLPTTGGFLSGVWTTSNRVFTVGLSGNSGKVKMIIGTSIN